MIHYVGPLVLVELDGLIVAVGKTFKSGTCLTIIGTERVAGDYENIYNPFTLHPEEGDENPFASVYRKLNTLVSVEGSKFTGPFPEEDHPLLYRRFLWFLEGEPSDLLAALSLHGFSIKVRSIPHRGNDALVEAAVTALQPWFDDQTVVEPNPRIEQEKKKKETEAKWQEFDVKADRIDRWLWRYVFPVLVLLWVCAIAFCAFAGHWWTALTILSCPFIGWKAVLWLLRC